MHFTKLDLSQSAFVANSLGGTVTVLPNVNSVRDRLPHCQKELEWPRSMRCARIPIAGSPQKMVMPAAKQQGIAQLLETYGMTERGTGMSAAIKGSSVPKRFGSI